MRRNSLFTGLVVAFLLVVLAACQVPASKPVMTRVQGTISMGDGSRVDCTWTRVGTSKGRVESRESGNADMGWLTLYRDGQLWSLDPATLTGRRTQDQPDSFRIPILMLMGVDDVVKSPLMEFEIGQELAWMHSQGIKAQTVPGSSPPYEYYEIADGELHLTARLIVDPALGHPVRVELLSSAGPVLILDYQNWQTDIPVDEALFALPEGYTIKERG